MMRAIEIRTYGGPGELVMSSVPVPQPGREQVLVKVRAFGLNRAELYMRSGAWGEVAKIPGIECVGEVHQDPRGRLDKGARVLALMGGLGRTINGSYAEYVCVPANNVLPVVTSLSFGDLAALPESYATAWTCVRRNLALSGGQALLVRAGTSALGQAAINIAREGGARVLATTRSAHRFETLEQLGAEPLLERPELAAEVRRRVPHGVDATLDIVGTSTLLDSMAATRRDGRVCLAGFMGGHTPLSGFDPVMHMPGGVQLSVFASFRLGTRDFPVDDVPFQQLVRKAEEGRYRAKPARTFPFEEIRAAHELMEANAANGKVVVVVDEAEPGRP